MASPSRPPPGPLVRGSRLHSRSSSQLATLTSLSAYEGPHASTSASPSPARAGGKSVPSSPRGVGGMLELQLAPMDAEQEDEDDKEELCSGEQETTEPESSSDDDGEAFTFPTRASARKQSAPPSSLGAPPSNGSAPPPLSPQGRSNSFAASAAEQPLGLAAYIQQKRRQASAPFLAPARSSSLFSPGAGFSLLPHAPPITGSSTAEELQTPLSPVLPPWTTQPPRRGGSTSPGGASGGEDGRRSRSRRPTRGQSFTSSSPSGHEGLALNLGEGMDEELANRLQGMVMTPTTEEWRQLGGSLSDLADLRAKDEARLAAGLLVGSQPPSDGSGSGDSTPLDSDLAPTPPLVLKHTKTGSHSHTHSFSTLESNGVLRSSHAYSQSASAVTLTLGVPATAPMQSSSTFLPTHRQQKSEPPVAAGVGGKQQGAGLPNLSRGSLQSSVSPSVGTPTSPGLGGAPSSSSLREAAASSAATASTGGDDGRPAPVYTGDVPPAPLDYVSQELGPIDPARYSAVTGARTIENFVVLGQAGEGAYGLVRRARERGPDGSAIGPELVVKYVIKQRILADCWKKHKTLGPIPIEVHVLDFLRRVPYTERPRGRRRRNGFVKPPLVNRRDSMKEIVKEGTKTGHPNICPLLDFFEDREFYYLIMPCAGADPSTPGSGGGRDLFDYVDVHPDGLPATSIQAILEQVANSLFFLHTHNISHRDIKDENIVLSRDEVVQVIDFGSAAYVKDGKKFDTFSGTLDFASPEVLRGERYGGKETDVWALGVLAYVMICGECPFWTPDEARVGLTASSRAATALQAKADSTTALEDGSCGLDDAVDLIQRCLEVIPKNRPTADDILGHAFICGKDGWRGARGWEVYPDDGSD